MIVIDGRESELSLANYGNLEEILVKVAARDNMTERVVTDVIVNEEPFSEIYPHQAEDYDVQDIERLEIKTVTLPELAVDIARELYKVVQLMSDGGRRVADLFRQADEAEALDMYQDLLEVTRDFLAMVSVLREKYGLQEGLLFSQTADEFSDLVTEMLEVQESGDWILLADLLEYEYLPAVNGWKQIVADLRKDVKKHCAGNGNGQ